MPHAPCIKNLAQQLDPECWLSYSGKIPGVKRALDARRSSALRMATDAWVKADAYTRRATQAHLMFGHRAGLAEEAKIMKEIEMERAKPLDPLREAVRAVALHPKLGKNVAAELLADYGDGAKRVVDVHRHRWPDVIAACNQAIVTIDGLNGLMKSTPPWETKTMSKMPPLKMKMLLHFGTSPAGPFVPENVRKSEAYTTHVKELIRDGLIERPTKDQRYAHAGWSYKLTAKGQVFFKAVLETPLPVRTEPEWKMPTK